MTGGSGGGGADLRCCGCNRDEPDCGRLGCGVPACGLPALLVLPALDLPGCVRSSVSLPDALISEAAFWELVLSDRGALPKLLLSAGGVARVERDAVDGGCCCAPVLEAFDVGD